MKIDYDMVRSMLLVIEDQANGVNPMGYSYLLDEHFPESDNEMIQYHVKFLHDSRLIECVTGNFRSIIDITPKGREYLDNIRSNDIWSQTKAAIKPVGDITLDTVKEVAKHLLLSALGLK